MMKKFVWGGSKEKGVTIDYNHKRTLLVVKARYNYARLAKALSGEGKNEKAQQVLDYCMETLPVEKLSYDMYIPDIIEAYFAAGAPEKAIDLTNKLSSYYFEKMDYYFRQDPSILASADLEVQTAMQYISRVGSACKENGKPEISTDLNARLEKYYSQYIRIVQPAGKR
jgi:hypothetical protein